MLPAGSGFGLKGFLTKCYLGGFRGVFGGFSGGLGGFRGLGCSV